MKKHSNSLLIAVGLSIVSIMFINFTLTAQDIVFTATENNLGLNSTLGQFGTVGQILMEMEILICLLLDKVLQNTFFT